MLEKKQYLGFEYFPLTNSFTIHKDNAVVEDGVIIAISRESCAFTCNKLNEMIDYIGNKENPLVIFAKHFWTEEVISDFMKREKLSEQ